MVDYQAADSSGGRLARFGEFIDTQRRLALLEQLLKHVEAAPADARVRLRLGDVLQSLQRIDEAVVQYREAATLLARRGFEKQSRAVRALIFRLIPDDAGAIRDMKFTDDVEIARTQEPLPREEKRLGEEEEAELAVSDLILVTAGGAIARPLRALPAAPWSTKTEEISLDTPAPREPVFSLTEAGISVDVSVDQLPSLPGAIGDAKNGARPRDRRVDPRAHADGVVRLHAAGTSVTGFLEDVSQTGLFISGPRAFREGAIVDLALQLPQAAWVGLARARVMRSVDASRRRAAGLGLALLWADTPTERWIEDFVSAVFGVGAIRRAADFAADGGKKEDDIRRAHPRGEIALPAVLRGPEFEVAGWVRDLSLGGAFVEGPRVYGPGRRVDLLLWMPGRYAPVVVEAVVAHDSKPPANGYGRGTGVRFIKMSDALEIELRQLLD